MMGSGDAEMTTDESASVLVRAAHDLRRHPGARALAPAPVAWDDTLDALRAAHIEPALPDSAAVTAFHAALVPYLQSADPLLPVRMVGGMVRGTIYRTADGTRLRATDNAPAWWVHYALVQGARVALDAVESLMATLPARLFEVSRTMPTSLAAAGWHLAHLVAVKDGLTDWRRWTRREAIGYCVRSLHPCNHGLVPKVDWQRWGGDSRVLAFLTERFAARYAAVWAPFLELAGVAPEALGRVTGPVRVMIADVGGADTADARDITGASARRRVSSHPLRAPAAGDAATAAASEGTAAGATHRTTYRATRLLFRRDVIETLAPHERFAVETPVGTFVMTRAEFDAVFAHVRRTASYRDRGVYHYPTVPRAALPFLQRVAQPKRPAPDMTS